MWHLWFRVRMVANGYIINADLPLPEQKYPKINGVGAWKAESFYERVLVTNRISR